MNIRKFLFVSALCLLSISSSAQSTFSCNLIDPEGPVSPWGKCYGDINGDGREDIVLSPSELKGMVYRISWFEAPADPLANWTEHIIEDQVEAVHHFVGVADFDKDGNPDVATAEMLQGDDPDEVKIYYSAGSGASWIKQVLSDSGCHSMRIMDIDGDGDMDLFGANHNDQKIRLWVNLTD